VKEKLRNRFNPHVSRGWEKILDILAPLLYKRDAVRTDLDGFFFMGFAQRSRAHADHHLVDERPAADRAPSRE
jgi:hypothetical protein